MKVINIKNYDIKLWYKKSKIMTDLFLYETKNLQYVIMGWQMVSENTSLKTLERFLQPFSPHFFVLSTRFTHCAKCSSLLSKRLHSCHTDKKY